MPKLHIYKNEKETCHAFAKWTAERVIEKLADQDRFSIALSAAIPKQFFKVLATEYVEKVDWSKIYIFFQDEKFVAAADEKNTALTTLSNFAEQVSIPKDQIHCIKTNVDPERSAKEYESFLKTYFANKNDTFDLAILGMNEEGNFLSLPANNKENNYPDALVMPVYDQHENSHKITLTIPAINASSIKVFLATGKGKEDVVQQVLKGKYEPEKYPAQLIVTNNQSVHWFLDESAAAKLIRPIS